MKSKLNEPSRTQMLETGGKNVSGVYASVGRKYIVSTVALAFVAALCHAADLTIQNGVVVKFGSEAQLVARDRLTIEKGVVLTSSKDDAIGGPSGLDPQRAAIGDWLGVRFEKSAASLGVFTLEDLQIRYAGAGLTLRGVSPQIKFSQFSENDVGLRLLDTNFPVITGSSFLRNGVGLLADGGSKPTISATQFSQNASKAIDNKTPASVIVATGNWWGHASGPKDAIGNPQGLGDVVSDGVNYGSYLSNAPLISPSIKLVNSAAFFERREISLDIACINASEYRIAEGDGFANVAFQSLNNGKATVNYTVSDGDGLKQLSVQFRSPSGNVTTAALAGGVMIDALPPKLTISNPAAGSYVSDPISIDVEASDAAGIKQVEFYVNGNLLGVKTAKPYSMVWDPNSVTESSHVLKIVVIDNNGRISEKTNTISVVRSPYAPRVVSRNLPTNNYTGSSEYQSSTPYSGFNSGYWLASGFSGWVKVDLGTEYTLSKVSFTPGVLTSSGARSETRVEKILTSTNGSDFVEVYSESVLAKDGERRDVIIASKIGRYVQIYIPNSQSWVGLGNIEIQGVPYPVNAPADQKGPDLSNAKLGEVPLKDGLAVQRSAIISVDASDRSGIARVEFLLDGVVINNASGQNTYSAQLNIDSIANGEHTLAFRAFDSLGNVSMISFSVNVAHAAPKAPMLTQPSHGFTTRTSFLPVSGQAPAGSKVQLLVNGVADGVAITTGADGRFSGNVNLQAGNNQIQATATDQYGTSALSSALTVMLDVTVPTSPSNLTAMAQASGKVRLTWTKSTDPNAASYDLYRSNAVFTGLAGASKVNASPLQATTYDDLPSQDGVWYYRAVAVNSVGTPSLPTDLVQATSDGTTPRALSISYKPQGKVDPVSGRIGQGMVSLTLKLNEALQTDPYLAIVPKGGAPITVELTKSDATTYSGSFVIDSNTPSGIANALFSARDSVGNRGTDIDSGETLNIDTAGAELSSISLNPSAPIKNDVATPIHVTLKFSKAVKGTPKVSYLLSGPVRSPVALSGLVALDATTWTASFTLPNDAGLGGSESLTFSASTVDDLDNLSTKVSAYNRFQIYQGQLPALDIPFGLSAKAQPGGKVKLTWQAVDTASGYQLYRQIPGQVVLQPLARTTGIEYIDQTELDGIYKYSIATVRQSNDQESLSEQSALVEAAASANAPGAPQNLTLSLTGQGIVAKWQAPLASKVDSYKLYRSTGTSIGSIEGLTALKNGIKQTLALDPSPSPTQGAYVVTALDAAGNESAISNSAYLNASLLPVRNLRVEQLGNELPVISWSAPNGNLSGYLVYVGPEEGKTKLTPSVTTSTQFTDSGYTAGERRYTIATVDANGVEMPRSLVLPSFATQIASGLPIKRGVMNKLQVQVVNTSGSAVENVRVDVRLPINKAATQFKDHRSEQFNLGPNQTRLVPVIVGGYADLPSNAQVQIGVEIAANEGELVKIARNQVVDVTDSGLVVGMSTDEFTRGATGKIKLNIENTSDVDIELLTATNNGGGDSSELRFKILDADGNVLATQPYKQVFGANVVTVINGQTVARIPAGSSYVSDVFALNVPSSSPNSIRVKLEVDKLRYHSGQEDEVIIAGRGSEKTVSLLDTAYLGEVTDVSPISSFGDQDVLITGRAIDRSTKAPLPNSRVKLVLNQQGFERVFMVLTDASGAFSYSFKPTLTDSGLYKVSAVHPDMTDRTEQKAFTINRVTVGPTPYKLDVPKNYPFTIPFSAKAGVGTTARNLRLVLDPASQPTGQVPAGVSVQLAAPVNLTERQTLNIPVVFTANNNALPTGSLIFNVVSDEHASPLAQVTVNYTLSEAKPYLTTTPSYIETGLAQGGSQIESFVVQNKGLQDAVNLRFSLTRVDGSAAPEWVSIASQSNGTLAVGEKRSIDLSFMPPAGTSAGVHEFKLLVHGDNVPLQQLNIYVSVTQSGKGSVLFKASDIYTATVDKSGKLIPGLANATITLQNEDVATVTQELVTDSLGEALFQNLPAGRYKFRAKAANHQEVGGRLQIKPGITFNQPVFLDYNLVTVEWSVREISIQDRYEVVLNAVFETDVPAAVVVFQPTSINLPKMNTGDVYYGELTLTNYGLIRAEDVKQHLPKDDGYFRYEFLVDVPGTLEAKQRITIPYRVVALQSFEAAASAGTASGGGCYSYSNRLSVSCQYSCTNGNKTTCGASASWFTSDNSSCSGGSGSGGGGGGFGGFGGGFGGGGMSTPLKMKNKKCVYVPKGGGESECK